MADSRPVVAIVGAGFGGLRAAQALSRAPVKVVLVDRRNYHLFQPLLYQVATAGLAPGEIAYPVRAILRNQRNLEFRLAEVTGVELTEGRLITSTGTVDYDYLILAFGAETNYYGLESIAVHSFGLKDLDDAVAIRNHVLRMFELAAQEGNPEIRQAMLTFAVVGGGPTGVESAGALAELTRLAQLKDFAELNPKDLRVILLEASDRLLAGMPETLREATAETLWRKHVEVRFGATVTDFNGRELFLKSGEVIPARTLIWAAGARTVRLANSLGVVQSSLGRVVVAPTLQLPAHPKVYTIGDAAYWEIDGEPLPMVAPVAVQQAWIAGDDWSQRGRRAVGQVPLSGFSGVVDLADHPPHATGWLSQSAHGADRLGVGLLFLRPGGTGDHAGRSVALDDGKRAELWNARERWLLSRAIVAPGGASLFLGRGPCHNAGNPYSLTRVR
jgi:NADH dehydrogenase